MTPYLQVSILHAYNMGAPASLAEKKASPHLTQSVPHCLDLSEPLSTLHLPSIPLMRMSRLRFCHCAGTARLLEYEVF